MFNYSGKITFQNFSGISGKVSNYLNSKDIRHQYTYETERFPDGFHVEFICGMNMTFAMYGNVCNPDGIMACHVWLLTVVVNTFVCNSRNLFQFFWKFSSPGQCSEKFWHNFSAIFGEISKLTTTDERNKPASMDTYLKHLIIKCFISISFTHYVKQSRRHFYAEYCSSKKSLQVVKDCKQLTI